MEKKIKFKINKVWEKYLDRLWGLVIHNRDKGCQLCKKQEGKMDAHHIFGRRAKNTRWDIQNGIKLCFYCHHYRILHDPEGLRIVAINKIGFREYELLYMRFKQVVKYIDYQGWYLLLKHELEKLNVRVPKKPKVIRTDDEKV